MISRIILITAACAPLLACGRPQPNDATAPARSQPAPELRTPPKIAPAIDPKSPEAARLLVQGFADMLNQRRFDGAYMLLGPTAPPRKEFDGDFSQLSDLSVTVGSPGGQDGAAGSIYISVPLTVTGTADGRKVERSATAVVRRVNDVPGSTEAQRRWHIERIDWKSG